MTTPKTEDVRKAVATAVDQVRTPLLAALGAGNLATHAVTDAVAKAKENVTKGSETARKSLEELPTDVESLRERLDRPSCARSSTSTPRPR
jgi:heparin binding hemagglutinin HbhA